ncbi:MAG: hypothetical protein ACT4PJ_12300 [Gemmatimonadaceae bacterium]
MNDTKPNRIPQIYGYTVCLIAIGLFAWHWRWLRERAAEERAIANRAV